MSAELAIEDGALPSVVRYVHRREAIYLSAAEHVIQPGADRTSASDHSSADSD